MACSCRRCWHDCIATLCLLWWRLQIARAVHDAVPGRRVLVHTDASQSVGKVATLVDELQVDLLNIVGHKLYAPKVCHARRPASLSCTSLLATTVCVFALQGIGALYVRAGTPALVPLIHGASQESGRRAGTENVPYCVGLGVACRIAHETLRESVAHLQELRDRCVRPHGVHCETLRAAGRSSCVRRRYFVCGSGCRVR